MVSNFDFAWSVRREALTRASLYKYFASLYWVKIEEINKAALVGEYLSHFWKGKRGGGCHYTVAPELGKKEKKGGGKSVIKRMVLSGATGR